jgi:acyl-CoA synthetase (NDP forming)
MTALTTDLKTLVSPASIAITGATVNPEDLGSYVLRNIIFSNYKGKLFPISKDLSQLYEFDTYSSIRDIKEEIDLAILATSADRVIDDVFDCTRSKVKNICIISKGFAETGSNGLVLQKKIVKMVSEAGIRLLGPNSLGIISPASNLNATISPVTPKEGRAVFLSQSGALINALCEYSDFYKLGFSQIVGLGNKASVDESDFLEYYSRLGGEEAPTVLGAYLESIADGREFIDVAAKFSRKAPFITLIPSESPKTREYIYSHSGSILQKDEVIDLALKQSGVIKVYTQQELFDLLLSFAWQTLPRGRNTAIVSNAGGGLILAIEQLYRKGLKLVNFSSDVKKILIEQLDWRGQTAGVVDLGGEALSLNYLKALDIVLGDHDVNSVIVILSPQVMTQIEESAEVIGRLAKEHGKTIIVSFMGYEGVEKGIQSLARYFVPAFKSVDRAVFALSKMYEYTKWKGTVSDQVTKFAYKKPLEKGRSVKVLEMIEKARLEKKLELDACDYLKVLKQYDIEVENVKQISSLKDVVTFGKKYKYPVEFYCMKNDWSKVVYKTDQAKAVYENHFKRCKQGKNHPFNGHLVKKVYENRVRFKLEIAKDVYYEHRDKGWTIKELENLSFGHYLTMSVLDVQKKGELSMSRDGIVEALVPLNRKQVDEAIEEVNFVKQLGFVKGKSYQEVKEELIAFARKMIGIPLDFPQILAVAVECVIDKAKLKVIDCEIKLDLIV